jgi:hypothetical protein
MSFAPFDQFPVAPRPLASCQCWLAGAHGPSVPLLRAFLSTASAQPPTNRLLGPVRSTSSERAPSLGQSSESQRTLVPSPGCPASPASGRLHGGRARTPDERPPPRRWVRPRPSPTQARASATGGFEASSSTTGQQVEAGGQVAVLRKAVQDLLASACIPCKSINTCGSAV